MRLDISLIVVLMIHTFAFGFSVYFYVMYFTIDDYRYLVGAILENIGFVLCYPMFFIIKKDLQNLDGC